MVGVIACEALYHEVDRLREDDRFCEAAVRYVPQELHEFPVNVPDESAIRTTVQAAVDDLDEVDRSRIVVAYARGEWIESIRSAHTPLVFVPIDDCVSAVLDEPVSAETGEAKASGTYYLTRGTIDCGVDGYKLYAAYRGEVQDLLARFERARERHPDLRITWADGERFAAAVARDRRPSAERVGAVFHEVFGGFDRVELVDTGRLYDFHREYADSVRGFVERLSAEYGDGHAVELAIVDGETTPLERAASEPRLDCLEQEGVKVYRPE